MRILIMVFVLCARSSSAVPSMNIYPRQMPLQQYGPMQYGQNIDPNIDPNMYYYEQPSQKADRNANYNSSMDTSEKNSAPVQQAPPPPQPQQTAHSPGMLQNETPPSKEDNAKCNQLQKLVQQLYMAQAQVQLEATEIKRAQTVASAAQQNLEDTANNVRIITAALRAAQESVANAALRAQTAQLQLAAHDQLLFTARQKVDALSAQMVGLQAEVGITAGSRPAVDLPALLNKLKQPLQPEDQPKPVTDVGEMKIEEEQPHAMNIHSADNAAAWSRSPPVPDAVERSRRSGLRQDDVRDLLQWVRREKDAELSRAMSAGLDSLNIDREKDYSKRYVRDFVTNMQNLYGQHDDFDDESRDSEF